MRYFRIAIAMFCFYSAYDRNEWYFAGFGLFFLIQAIFNFGCGSQGCNLPNKKE